MKILPGVVITMMIVGIGIWWQTYKFHDCRNVGHSRLYCIMDIGK